MTTPNQINFASLSNDIDNVIYPKAGWNKGKRYIEILINDSNVTHTQSKIVGTCATIDFTIDCGDVTRLNKY